MAVVERVQQAVGVLLRLAEKAMLNWSRLALPRAEQPDRAVGVAEDEAAKVAVEGLGADPDRDEVVVGADVGQLALDEPLLQAPRTVAGAAWSLGARWG